MCLTNVYTEEEKQAWLKDQPDEIVAYKVVRVSDCGSRVRPPCRCHPCFYTKRNVVDGIEYYESIEASDGRYYVPLFHLFCDDKDAEDWAFDFHRSGFMTGEIKVIKCKIPKAMITDVGIQQLYTVIVTKEFEFIQCLGYFQGQEAVQCA
jgi:hypothetical protein